MSRARSIILDSDQFPDHLSIKGNHKFDLLYLDPPWAFRNWSTDQLVKYDLKWARANGRSPYPVMKQTDLFKIPIGELGNKDSVMLMWTTHPKLQDGLDLMKQYGYEFKTVAFCWVKLNPSGVGWHFGLGYHTRQNPELCLLGTRGKGLKRIDNSVPNLIIWPRGAHSAKPPVTRDRIIRLYGNVTRCELFARSEPNGFLAWGNEVPLRPEFEVINDYIAPPIEAIIDEDEALGLPVRDTIQESYDYGQQMGLI